MRKNPGRKERREGINKYGQPKKKPDLCRAKTHESQTKDGMCRDSGAKLSVGAVYSKMLNGGEVQKK